MDEQHKQEQLPARRLHYIEGKLDELIAQTSRMSIYLFGDEKLAKDSVGAMAQLRAEFNSLKSEMELVKKQVELVEKDLTSTKMKQVKYNVYTIVMWAALGATGALILAYIFQVILTIHKP